MKCKVVRVGDQLAIRTMDNPDGDQKAFENQVARLLGKLLEPPPPTPPTARDLSGLLARLCVVKLDRRTLTVTRLLCPGAALLITEYKKGQWRLFLEYEGGSLILTEEEVYWVSQALASGTPSLPRCEPYVRKGGAVFLNEEETVFLTLSPPSRETFRCGDPGVTPEPVALVDSGAGWRVQGVPGPRVYFEGLGLPACLAALVVVWEDSYRDRHLGVDPNTGRVDLSGLVYREDAFFPDTIVLRVVCRVRQDPQDGDMEAPLYALPVRTAFTQPQVWTGGGTEDAPDPGSVTRHVGPDTPIRGLFLRVRRGFPAPTTLHVLVRDGEGETDVLVRRGASRPGGGSTVDGGDDWVLYVGDLTDALQPGPEPRRVTLRGRGQAEDMGTLVLTPAFVGGRWTLDRDGRSLRFLGDGRIRPSLRTLRPWVTAGGDTDWKEEDPVRTQCTSAIWRGGFAFGLGANREELRLPLRNTVAPRLFRLPAPASDLLFQAAEPPAPSVEAWYPDAPAASHPVDVQGLQLRILTPALRSVLNRASLRLAVTPERGGGLMTGRVDRLSYPTPSEWAPCPAVDGCLVLPRETVLFLDFRGLTSGARLVPMDLWGGKGQLTVLLLDEPWRVDGGGIQGVDGAVLAPVQAASCCTTPQRPTYWLSQGPQVLERVDTWSEGDQWSVQLQTAPVSPCASGSRMAPVGLPGGRLTRVPMMARRSLTESCMVLWRDRYLLSFGPPGNPSVSFVGWAWDGSLPCGFPEEAPFAPYGFVAPEAVGQIYEGRLDGAFRLTWEKGTPPATVLGAPDFPITAGTFQEGDTHFLVNGEEWVFSASYTPTGDIGIRVRQTQAGAAPSSPEVRAWRRTAAQKTE